MRSTAIRRPLKSDATLRDLYRLVTREIHLENSPTHLLSTGITCPEESPAGNWIGNGMLRQAPCRLCRVPNPPHFTRASDPDLICDPMLTSTLCGRPPVRATKVNTEHFQTTPFYQTDGWYANERFLALINCSAVCMV